MPGGIEGFARPLFRKKKSGPCTISHAALLCSTDRWRLWDGSTTFAAGIGPKDRSTLGMDLNDAASRSFELDQGARRRGVNETNKYRGAGLLP